MLITTYNPKTKKQILVSDLNVFKPHNKKHIVVSNYLMEQFKLNLYCYTILKVKYNI